MCSKQDITKVEQQVRKYRVKKYKALDKKNRRKLEFENAIYVALFRDDLVSEKHSATDNLAELGVVASAVFEATPDCYSIVCINVYSESHPESFQETGVANRMSIDKLNAVYGYDIALKRAVRKAARVLAGLE